MNDDWILGQRAADGDDAAFIELYERNMAGIVGSLRAGRKRGLINLRGRSEIELTERLTSADVVRGAIRSLPQEQQLVMILNLLVGCDDREIGEWMSKNPDEVRDIRLAAQHGLRRRLQSQPSN